MRSVLLLTLLLQSCGMNHTVSGTTRHKVDIQVKTSIEMVVQGCRDKNPVKRAECLEEAIAELEEALNDL